MHCVAAGETTSVAFFAENSESTSFKQIDSLGGERLSHITVPVRRVDDLIQSRDEIFLLKTDTQGYELNALKGAARLLNEGRVRFLMVEFSFGLQKASGTSPFDLLEFIYDRGFICTYMAYHTLLKTKKYGIVGDAPGFSQETVSFEEFVESLRIVRAPETAGVSGWTDLLCANFHTLSS